MHLGIFSLHLFSQSGWRSIFTRCLLCASSMFLAKMNNDPVLKKLINLKKKKYSMNKLIVVNSWLWPSSTGKFIDELIQMKFYWCNCSRKKVLQVLGISRPCESFLTLRSQRIWGSRMKNIPLLNFYHFHTTNCNNKFYICKNIWASLNQLPASACCYYICNGQEWAIEKVPGVQLMRLTDCVIVITYQPPSW